MRLRLFLLFLVLLLAMIGAAPHARAGEINFGSARWSLRDRPQRFFGFQSGPASLATPSAAQQFLPAAYYPQSAGAGCIGVALPPVQSYAFAPPQTFSFNAPVLPSVPAIAGSIPAQTGFSYSAPVAPQVVAPTSVYSAAWPGPSMTVPSPVFQETQLLLQRLNTVLPVSGPLETPTSTTELSLQVLALTKVVEKLATQTAKHEAILKSLQGEKPKDP